MEESWELRIKVEKVDGGCTWNALNVEYQQFRTYGRAPFQEHGV